ncbi:hypothetical protein [Ohessyouella blattaphilus]|uniref:Uncharacterized protein n=1 Tax=Ohessyouella blattaphilus TaxID=2949333 RepID=A0ABT1EHS2_9FIRM|nr:hypothetical protein [Ohessyouella blattaphilus]MCP1110257.1 hypothetical protein [Ohessyouella blattaphilus]MCR8563651.1 hypothetical protein [Ohessyouella blattaphilus]
MSDVKKAYEHIVDFLNNETEKNLLLCGIADEEKHLSLLKALNAQGNLKGLILLIHTTKNGMEDFFHWAGIYKLKVPKKYGEGMKLSNLTIFFDNLSTKDCANKYNNYEFDFIIVWPIQSVTESEEEIRELEEMAKRQKTKKIVYLTIKEPWYNPERLKHSVDRIIKLDCENDDPSEYQRILLAYEEDMRRRKQRGF